MAFLKKWGVSQTVLRRFWDEIPKSVENTGVWGPWNIWKRTANEPQTKRKRTENEPKTNRERTANETKTKRKRNENETRMNRERNGNGKPEPLYILLKSLKYMDQIDLFLTFFDQIEIPSIPTLQVFLDVCLQPYHTSPFYSPQSQHFRFSLMSYLRISHISVYHTSLFYSLQSHHFGFLWCLPSTLSHISVTRPSYKGGGKDRKRTENQTGTGGKSSTYQELFHFWPQN